MKTNLNKFLIAIYRHLKPPLAGGVSLLLVFIVFPGLYVLLLDSSPSEKWITFIILVGGTLFVADVMFRLCYRLYIGAPYVVSDRVPFDKIYVEPHPYLPFVFKKHFKTEKASAATYPLHRGRYSFGQYTTNNLRFANGPGGNRDVSPVKPESLIRINCLGASTTGNYIEFEGKEYSYPMELEKILKAELDVPLEVNNCGVGGCNSADIFVRFALQVIDTKPDIVVIYHAYNDIQAYLTSGFESDYFHVRRNLGESYWKFRYAAKVPKIPIKFLDFMVTQWFVGDVRNSLIGEISKGEVNLDIDPSEGLQTYRRNIQHIIDLCRCNGIEVILSTYCHFLYEAIKQKPLHSLYHDIVASENEVMRSLATMNNLVLVDNARLVRQDEKYFVDSIHFTPEGMRRIAENIADAVKEILRSKK